jgi:hypothetical protein
VRRLLHLTWSGHPVSSIALSLAAALAFFTGLTVLMTWPQARQLATHAADHQDVYFNMWRLGWFAHALASSPSTLFEGNIFYPERSTLTFSDAMMVEGAVAAPLLWAGVPQVLVHNLLLLGAIIGTALGMYVLVGRLTRSRSAAVIAGIIFAFAPYRFEHYMHMELQWTVWMPWAFWAVHRTIDSGRWRDGLQAGAFVALQMLSSIYYGIFLATSLPLVAGLLLLTVKRPQALLAARSLAVGGLAAATICSIYALPYVATKTRVGERPKNEIIRYSARPYDYLIATPDNRMYGEVFRGRSERRLFPGTLSLLLALVGFLLRPPTGSALVYVIALVTAFEMSMGFHGYSYRFLYDHVPVFAGLRAPARMGIFVLMFLAILAAYGYRALSEAVPVAVRRTLPVLISCGLLLEYSVEPLQLVRYENSPPPVYDFLARLPPGVVVEFPTAHPHAPPGPDARYSYMSTFHWKPLLNGYSGYFPPSYLRRLAELRGFPDAFSIDVLRRTGVSYVVVHLELEEPSKHYALLADIQNHRELRLLAQLKNGTGMALLFRLE